MSGDGPGLLGRSRMWQLHANPDDGNHALEPRQAFTDAAKFLVHLLPKILDLAAVGSALRRDERGQRRAGSHHCRHNLRF